MRLVTYVGIVDEVGPSEYAANETTYTINLPGMIAGEKHQYAQQGPQTAQMLSNPFSFDLFFPVGAKLVDYMHDTGFHQFPKDGEKNPFAYAWNIEFWDFFEQRSDHRKYFADYMAERRKGLVTWHEVYPMAGILGSGARTDPEAVLLVDVGGNSGHEAVSFHEKHPEVPGRIVLEDLPCVIENVRKSGQPKDLELIEYDFFTPQPVKGMYLHSAFTQERVDDRQALAHTISARFVTTGPMRIAKDSSPIRLRRWKRDTQGY